MPKVREKELKTGAPSPGKAKRGNGKNPGGLKSKRQAQKIKLQAEICGSNRKRRKARGIEFPKGTILFASGKGNAKYKVVDSTGRMLSLKGPNGPITVPKSSIREMMARGQVKL